MKAYDENFISCIEALFDNFWILRKEKEDLYYLIREYENELRTYFNKNFHFRLVIKPEFVKLEKIIVDYKDWMKIESFRDTKDFVLFFCLLAFLDDKVDAQFTLEDICDSIVSYYPNDHIIWTENEGYNNRLTLIRVIRFAINKNLMFVVDRDLDGFKGNASHAVLFQGTIMIKYFMRNLAYDLETANSFKDIIELHANEEKDLGVERKHRIYRKLFIEPVIYEDEVYDDEFAYLKQYAYSIKDHVDKYSDFQYEQYKSTVLLTRQEDKADVTKVLFPEEKKNVSKLAIQFATVLRNKVEEEEFVQDSKGRVELTNIDFTNILKDVKSAYQIYWTTNQKKATIDSIVKELIDYLTEWNLCKVIDEYNLIILDTLGRVEGKYEFEGETGEK
ncbi:TIGR02678 family protein [Bacillus lacus]|uniref:TIGR02678 family protein n=1 Tax=Metabacillus lacus TaxID=1983721 RepID=A0A7X2LYL4_9BACI|nr:TIGR02678 family protein [Metabacillus lacus]